MEPLLCAPILADYFIIYKDDKTKYDASTLNKQPKLNKEDFSHLYFISRKQPLDPTYTKLNTNTL